MHSESQLGDTHKGVSMRGNSFALRLGLLVSLIAFVVTACGGSSPTAPSSGVPSISAQITSVVPQSGTVPFVSYVTVKVAIEKSNLNSGAAYLFFRCFSRGETVESREDCYSLTLYTPQIPSVLDLNYGNPWGGIIGPITPNSITYKRVWLIVIPETSGLASTPLRGELPSSVMALTSKPIDVTFSR